MHFLQEFGILYQRTQSYLTTPVQLLQRKNDFVITLLNSLPKSRDGEIS